MHNLILLAEVTPKGAEEDHVDTVTLFSVDNKFIAIGLLEAAKLEILGSYAILEIEPDM